jgi:hypothetical protein
MIDESRRRIGIFCVTALVVLILLSSGSAIPLLTPLKALAFDEEGYYKFIVSKVNESNSNNNNTDVVQLPVAAKGPAIPPKGYLVEEIHDHLYWVTDGSYNTMFLVTDKGVVAVDAPPSLGQKYLRAIAEVTDKPVNYLIYSHAHIDISALRDCSPRMLLS